MIAPGITLYVIRHGETEHNVERRLTGQMHSPLTPNGLKQAKRSGEILARLEPNLARFDFIASPLERTRQTMELVRQGAGLSPHGYHTDERVKEIDVGTWFGISMEEARRKMPEHVRAYEADPWNFARGGKESFAMVHERIKGFLETLKRNSVIVAHFHPLRMFRAHSLGLTPEETLAWNAPNQGVLRVKAGHAEFFGN